MRGGPPAAWGTMDAGGPPKRCGGSGGAAPAPPVGALNCGGRAGTCCCCSCGCGGSGGRPAAAAPAPGCCCCCCCCIIGAPKAPGGSAPPIRCGNGAPASTDGLGMAGIGGPVGVRDHCCGTTPLALAPLKGAAVLALRWNACCGCCWILLFAVLGAGTGPAPASRVWKPLPDAEGGTAPSKAGALTPIGCAPASLLPNRGAVDCCAAVAGG